MIDYNKKDYLVQLDRIVERQLKVYSDLLDRVISLLKDDGHHRLAQRIEILKKLYGLGEFKEVLAYVPKSVRNYVDNEEAKFLIVNFLKLNSPKKFRYSDIQKSIDGRMTEDCWHKARKDLIKEKSIKHSGANKNQVYWIE